MADHDDPEVAFPLAIASTVLGMVGLTVPVLAFVAVLLALGGYALNRRHAPTRAFAFVGVVLGVVGIASMFVGGIG
ncbi:hypothetical protein [Demequina mangrovi]|uniref:Uncharacterized protein n=1 Tax=Demequina mangrovi TaxID=1043493 RepID=A0A1H6YX19_9MICO|nr:hypothetical protein [Demequina mangrovi]SEJ44926.1 hypothetical protein SAMN05421637_1801 [Demequina mangrovi]